MRHLNYNHLLYFWTVLREGGVARAAESLHVTPQTISGQLKVLEDQLQGRLLDRVGRRLVPTDLGKVVFGYADEIFRRGLELARVARSASPVGPLELAVGLSDAVPKLLAYRVLEPVLRIGRPVHLTCHEGPLETLLAELATQRLDIVVSASGLPPEARVKAFAHLLGESDITVFASPDLARTLRRGFPQSLHGAPWLLPTERSAVRRVLDLWFEQRGIVPRVVGEFDDTALIKAFGQAGAGVFAAPSFIEREIVAQYRVRAVGRSSELRARFYAITTERRIKHPAVVAITTAATEQSWSTPTHAERSRARSS